MEETIPGNCQVGNAHCYPEQQQRYYFGTGFGAGWQNAAADTFDNNINPTEAQAWETTYWPANQVETFAQDYGDIGWYGNTWCHGPGVGDVCHGWYVQMNKFYGDYTASEKDHLICHEFGHATGLSHYPTGTNPSCMQEPSSRRFSDHDRNHINGYF